MENRNRIIALVVTIVIMLVLVIGGYFLFFNKPSNAETVSTEKQVSKLTDDSVISPVASYDSNSIWYFNSKGQLFDRQIAGTSSDEFSLPSLNTVVQKVLWPVTGPDFLLIANSGQTKYYYSNANKKYTQLPSNIRSMDWMPDGKRIVYIWQSGDNKHQQLMLANADASGFVAIKDVFWPDLIVKVSPDGKNVLLFRGITSDQNKIYMANLATGEFKTLVDSGNNTDAMWVAADKFVYVEQAETPKLMLYNLVSNSSQDLNTDATLDRVAVDAGGKNLYVDPIATSDVLWKINTTTFQKEKIFEFDRTILPRKLFMVSQMVGFINNLDQKLYILK